MGAYPGADAGDGAGIVFTGAMGELARAEGGGVTVFCVLEFFANNFFQNG